MEWYIKSLLTIFSIGLHCVKPYLINWFPKQADLISEIYKILQIIEILHLLGIL